MFRHARGEMFDWLQRNERDMTDCGRGSPVQHLARNRPAGPQLPGRPRQLPGPRAMPPCWRASNASVVHCPRSHDYFRASRNFPAARWPRPASTSASAPTAWPPCARSRSQNRRTEPVRGNARLRPSASRALRRNTSPHGHRSTARARSAWPDKIGELAANAFADLIALPFDGKPADSSRSRPRTIPARHRQHD